MKKLTLASVLTLCSTSIYADVAVIVNSNNMSTIDTNVIKEIYLGKNESFSDGNQVNPVNQDGTPVADEFNEKVIGKSGSQLEAYWSKLVITGKGTPPEKLASDQAVLDFVTANANAIGYIDSTKVTDKVKVIATF